MPDPVSGFFSIQNPGVRKAPDSKSATRYILLGAHELRARRTMCKSVVVFFQRYKLLTNKSGPIPA
jgi:hypothetical protein